MNVEKLANSNNATRATKGTTVWPIVYAVSYMHNINTIILKGGRKYRKLQIPTKK